MILRSIVAVLLCFASAGGARCASVGEVKATAQNWMQVTVEGIIIYTEPSECYIESPDRSGGIWVHAAMDGFEVGDPVLAVGTFAVVDGEPAVTNAAITPHGTPSEIRPLGMNNRAIGGASKWSPMFIWDYGQRRIPSGGGWTWQREWTPACGANNTGLLVTMWGTVKSVCYSPITGASWLYVDDGSGAVSDYGDTGVLVYADTQANIGDFVSVTGVSSTEPSFDDPSRLVRVVRTRSAGDVSVRAAPAPVYPFSDEFDGPVLDSRWTILPECGEMSLTADPGWLTITCPCGLSAALMQPESGDWDLEVRLRLERVPDSSAAIYVSLVDHPMFTPRPDSGQLEATLAALTRGNSVTDMLAQSGYGWIRFAAGDACSFRVRRRGSTVYGQMSPDGVDYTQETQATLAPTSLIKVWMLSRNSQPAYPLRGFVDYIRITKVTE